MNCKNCGASFENNLPKCPYCLSPNPEADRQLKDIRRLSGEIVRTRRKLSETTEKYIRILTVCVLALLCALAFLMFTQSWEISRAIRHRDAFINSDRYLAQLAQYEANDDFIALSELYDGKSLYSNDKFRKYEYIATMSSSYSYIYYNLLSLLEEEAWEDAHRQAIGHICDNIEYYYDALEREPYSFLEEYGAYEEVHLQAVERLTQKLEDLLQFSLDIPDEEMKDFRSLPTTEKQLLIERSFEKNE